MVPTKEQMDTWGEKFKLEDHTYDHERAMAVMAPIIRAARSKEQSRLVALPRGKDELLAKY